MKKWLKCFGLGFFSHSLAKENARGGYTNVFLGFVLALAFIWSGFIGGYMLPFDAHYGNAPNLQATVHSVFATSDEAKRIDALIEDGVFMAKRGEGEYSAGLLVNTLECEEDKQSYSQSGYDVIIDTRPAGSLAEIKAYCISNDGEGTEISYEDYLTLSDVARLNFEFRIRYTGKELVLTDADIEQYVSYLGGKGGEALERAEALASELEAGKLTKTDYDRAVYELYFTSYYPPITAYESTSKVPLLRNYYYHEYISKGINKYLFIFDDYMTCSFETEGGTDISFYGFYSELEDGALAKAGADASEAKAATDGFIKSAFRANWFLNAYAYLMNVITLAPFIALMVLVATLLTYSVMKLKGVESVTSLGAMMKIIGSFVWFSGLISAVISVVCAFFVDRSLVNAMPPVIFFIALLVRAVIFTIKENKLYLDKIKQQSLETEV